MPIVNVPATYETSADSGDQTSWYNARNATTANTFVNYNSGDDLDRGIGIARIMDINSWKYSTFRTFLFFDNFGIPSGSTINSITLNVFNSTSNGGINVQVVKSLAFGGGDGSSNFVAGDYNKWLDTSSFPPSPYATYGEYTPLGGWKSNDQNNSISLNSTAISDATADSYLNLVLVERSFDWGNTSPGRTLYGGVTYKVTLTPIELVIDYTAPSIIIEDVNNSKVGKGVLINSPDYSDISRINDGDTT